MRIVTKLLSMIRGPQDEPAPPQTTIRAESEHDEFADVLAGYEFAATLQIRTPLHVLKRHGEVTHGRTNDAPVYGTAADGIWVPRARDDIGIAPPPDSESASDIGPIRPVAYLPFLKTYRQIVERVATANDKLAEIHALASHPDTYQDFFPQLQQAYPGFPESRFDLTLDSLPNVGKARLMRLRTAGINGLEALAQSSIDDLTAIEGIGPTTAKNLQAEAQQRLHRATTPVAGERLSH